MRYVSAIMLVSVFLFCGCGCSSSGSTSPTPMAIQLGVYADGAAFFDCEGTLQYECLSKGTLNSKCKIKGSFSRFRTSDELHLQVELTINASGAYEVTGHYNSTVPFNLTLLGTGKTDAQDVVQKFTAGKGVIKYTGDPPYTYERPSKR